eukprot:TRINITY_DN2359_c0_g1_i9.p1 TRINITY_DN2359_c0_g1~~TRINITY_DN2359_c0_g1_i9.p1  ORF type:complete len:240 (-),score=49.38 TRINITY_DN2359_c0_g1_i9:37-756(-)
MWKSDVFQGKGKFTWEDGDYYEGDFEGGIQHGKGTFFWKDGDKYEGDFLNSNMTGKGIFTWATGNVYQGEFMEGEKNGWGKFIWVNGDNHEGQWLNGNMHGKGVYTWANFNRVDGVWINDKRVGGTFYEAVSNRSFCIPTLDQDQFPHFEILHSEISEVISKKMCTCSNPNISNFYFQYLYRIVHTERRGICLVCKDTCATENQIILQNPANPKPILGGKFKCSCGQGLLTHPCRAMKH